MRDNEEEKWLGRRETTTEERGAAAWWRSAHFLASLFGAALCVCVLRCVCGLGGGYWGVGVPRRSALGINIGAPVLAGFGAF